MIAIGLSLTKIGKKIIGFSILAKLDPQILAKINFLFAFGEKSYPSLNTDIKSVIVSLDYNFVKKTM